MIRKITTFIRRLKLGYWIVKEDERHEEAFRRLRSMELEDLSLSECYAWADLSGIQERYIGSLAKCLRARSGRGSVTARDGVSVVMKYLSHGMGRDI